jgi:hypothetical protein
VGAVAVMVAEEMAGAACGWMRGLVDVASGGFSFSSSWCFEKGG